MRFHALFASFEITKTEFLINGHETLVLNTCSTHMKALFRIYSYVILLVNTVFLVLRAVLCVVARVVISGSIHHKVNDLILSIKTGARSFEDVNEL